MINGSQEQTNNAVVEKYCYNDLKSNCDVYGALYQWDEMMQYTITEGVQGVCPNGWHIPSHDELTDLERSVCVLSGSTDCEIKFPKDNSTFGERGTSEGTILKASASNVNPWNGTDDFGFSALPAGTVSSGAFYYITSAFRFWSSSIINESRSWGRGLNSPASGVLRYDYLMTSGFSVRCLKN